MGKNITKFDAPARLGKVENATQIETDTLVRSARARLGQVGRATRSEAETIMRRSARARPTQQQASTHEWSCLLVHIQHNPVAWTWAPLFPLQCLVMCDTLHYKFCHHAYVPGGYMTLYYAIILLSLRVR